MRLYPRSFVGPDGKRKRVNNEIEEYELSLLGYERHREARINELQKGTDKEILRVKPEVQDEENLETNTVQVKTEVLQEVKEGVPKTPEKLTPQQRGALTRKRNKELKAGI